MQILRFCFLTSIRLSLLCQQIGVSKAGEKKQTTHFGTDFLILSCVDSHLTEYARLSTLRMCLYMYGMYLIIIAYKDLMTFQTLGLFLLKFWASEIKQFRKSSFLSLKKKKKINPTLNVREKRKGRAGKSQKLTNIKELMKISLITWWVVFVLNLVHGNAIKVQLWL